jgi:hypothetical protein
MSNTSKAAAPGDCDAAGLISDCAGSGGAVPTATGATCPLAYVSGTVQQCDCGCYRTFRNRQKFPFGDFFANAICLQAEEHFEETENQ